MNGNVETRTQNRVTTVPMARYIFVSDLAQATIQLVISRFFLLNQNISLIPTTPITSKQKNSKK
jgi:hypothetical protein